MTNSPFTSKPPVPGPGPQKVVSGRGTIRFWIGVAVVVAIVAALYKPLGLGEYVSQMRRQFVAIRYVQQAQTAVMSPPLERSRIEKMLDQAVAAAPEDRMIVRRAATTYMSIYAYKKCAALLEDLPDRDLLTETHYGHSLLAAGEIERGLEVIDGVLEQARQKRRSGELPATVYLMVLNDIGYGYSLAGVRLEEARGLVQEALSPQPLQPAVIDSLGWIYYRLGNFKEALFYLRRAARLMDQQENAEIYYHLGAAYSKTGQVRKAREAFQRCLALDPEFDRAREQLRLLRIKLPDPQNVQTDHIPTPGVAFT